MVKMYLGSEPQLYKTQTVFFRGTRKVLHTGFGKLAVQGLGLKISAASRSTQQQSLR